MPSTWHSRTWLWERTGESFRAGKVTLGKNKAVVMSLSSCPWKRAIHLNNSGCGLAPHLAILGQGFPFPQAALGVLPHSCPQIPDLGMSYSLRYKNQTQPK